MRSFITCKLVPFAKCNYQVKEDEIGMACSIRGRGIHTGIFVGKPEGNRPLGRLSRTLDDNIKMDLSEIGWSGTDCLG
jgi:hypothetical protein